MTYARLDDIFPEHPKVAALSDRAFRVHVRGICYSAKVLSDGFVPQALAKQWGAASVRSLVSEGLWSVENGGYLIHDYLDYNPSRSQVEGKRAADSNRKRGGIAAESDATPHARSRTPLPTPDPDPIDGVEVLDSVHTLLAEGKDLSPQAAPNGKGKNGTPFHLADVLNLGPVASLVDRYRVRGWDKTLTPGLLTGLVLGGKGSPAFGPRAVNAAIEDLYENAAGVSNPAGYLRERSEAHSLPDSSSSSEKSRL